jgi:hypothetical protein
MYIWTWTKFCLIINHKHHTSSLWHKKCSLLCLLSFWILFPKLLHIHIWNISGVFGFSSVVQNAISAIVRDWSLSVQTTQSVGRKVWNILIRVTSVLKSMCLIYILPNTCWMILFTCTFSPYQEFEFKSLLLQWCGTGLPGVAIQRHLLSEDISVLCWFSWMSFLIFNDVFGFNLNWFWKQAKHACGSCWTEG